MNSSNDLEKSNSEKHVEYRSIEYQDNQDGCNRNTIFSLQKNRSKTQKKISLLFSWKQWSFAFAIVLIFISFRIYYEFELLPSVKIEPTLAPNNEMSVEIIDSMRAIMEDYYKKMRIDPVGLPDYANSYHGAKVFAHSLTHLRGAKTRGPFKLQIFYEPRTPEIVIEKTTEAVMPGNCWPFVGSAGFITIELPEVITVTAISYEHAPSNLIPPIELQSAPKLIQLWAGLKSDVQEFIGDLIYIVPQYGPTIYKLQQPTLAKAMIRTKRVVYKTQPISIIQEEQQKAKEEEALDCHPPVEPSEAYQNLQSTSLWSMIKNWWSIVAGLKSAKNECKEMCLPEDIKKKIIWDELLQCYVGDGIENDLDVTLPPLVVNESASLNMKTGIPSRRYCNAFDKPI